MTKLIITGVERVLTKWAEESPQNRVELLDDVRGVIERELGLTLPDGIQVRATELKGSAVRVEVGGSAIVARTRNRWKFD